MIILGIETSCDETSAAVVEDGRNKLSNVVISQIEEHRIYGGVVPEIASRRHVEQICQVAESALSEAGVNLSDIDAVAVTYAPGLIGALLSGVGFAKGLAFTIKKPLIPVHHLRGHIASLYLTYSSLEPPFVAYIISGGHSHLVEVSGYTDFRVFGRAVDDAAGEAFDKVSRILGLGYPGGPAIESAAKAGDRERFKLPDPRTENPMDVSFSGLKTAVINHVNKSSDHGDKTFIADMAAAFQYRSVEMISARLINAAKIKRLSPALCGGVAANAALRERVLCLAKNEDLEVYFADKTLCSDNAAMIASAGYYEYKTGNTADLSLNAYASRDI